MLCVQWMGVHSMLCGVRAFTHTRTPCPCVRPVQVADDSNGTELSIFDPRAGPWVQVRGGGWDRGRLRVPQRGRARP